MKMFLKTHPAVVDLVVLVCGPGRRRKQKQVGVVLFYFVPAGPPKEAAATWF